MKKVIIAIVGILFSCNLFAQSEMPYFIKYLASKDTTYHNTQTINKIEIDPIYHTVHIGNISKRFKNTDFMDSIIIYQDCYRIAHNVADWDEVLFSSENFIFYKENPVTNMPIATLQIMINDTIPNGLVVYTRYSNYGVPEYYNFNNTCQVFVTEVKTSSWDGIYFNEDLSYGLLKDVPFTDDIITPLNQVTSRSALTRSKAQNSITLSNHMIGGIKYIAGSIAFISGCAAIITGAGIPAGLVAISGALGMISGGLDMVRSTDLICSDGSHTNGFDESSLILGSLSGAIGANISQGTAKALGKYAFTIARDGGYYEINRLLDESTELHDTYEKIKNIVQTNLQLGAYEYIGGTEGIIRLYAGFEKRCTYADKCGMMISKKEPTINSRGEEVFDISELKMINTPEGNRSINYHCDFSNLTPTEKYYYKPVYYVAEFDNGDYRFYPYFTTNKTGYFIVPGAKTMSYSRVKNSTFRLEGYAIWPELDTVGYMGFCISSTNQEPTIENSDITNHLASHEQGSFSAEFELNKPKYWYRAYVMIDNKPIYGNVKTLETEKPTDLDFDIEVLEISNTTSNDFSGNNLFYMIKLNIDGASSDLKNIKSIQSHVIGDMHKYDSEYTTIYDRNSGWLNKDYASKSIPLLYFHHQLNIDTNNYKAKPNIYTGIELIYLTEDSTGQEIEYHGTIKEFSPPSYEERPSLRINKVRFKGTNIKKHDHENQNNRYQTDVDIDYTWTGGFWTSWTTSDVLSGIFASDHVAGNSSYYAGEPPTSCTLSITNFITNSKIYSNPIIFVIENGIIIGAKLF